MGNATQQIFIALVDLTSENYLSGDAEFAYTEQANLSKKSTAKIADDAPIIQAMQGKKLGAVVRKTLFHF